MSRTVDMARAMALLAAAGMIGAGSPVVLEREDPRISDFEPRRRKPKLVTAPPREPTPDTMTRQRRRALEREQTKRSGRTSAGVRS
jgi:hypothetical protein